MIIVGILIAAFMLLFMYCVCKVSSECSRLEEQYLFKGGFDMKDEEKVYLLIDESVWDSDPDIQIIGITDNKNIIETMFKKYVEKVKKEMDIERDETDDLDKNYWESGSYKIEEDENSFLVYLDGYYSTSHTNIEICEKKLIKELESDLAI